jgi:hypothetical protein
MFSNLHNNPAASPHARPKATQRHLPGRKDRAFPPDKLTDVPEKAPNVYPFPKSAQG